MATPTDKIAAGLAEREKAKSGNHTSYSNLVDVPKTTAEVNNLAVRAKVLRDRMKAITDGVHAAVAKHRTEAESHFAAVGKQENENGVIVDTLGANQRNKMIEDSVSAYRKNVALPVSADDRAGILSELRTINQKLAAVADLHNDPVSIVMAGTLGSKQRQAYYADLQHAGPREIELAVKRALVQSPPDRELLAACFSRYDAFDKRTKSIVNLSKVDAARHAVQDQLNLGLQSIALAETALDSSIVLEDEVQGKQISTKRKIGLGVKKANLKKLGIEIDPVEGDGGKPTDKKTTDDATWQENLDAKFPPAQKPEPKTGTPKTTGLSDDEWQSILAAARSEGTET